METDSESELAGISSDEILYLMKELHDTTKKRSVLLTLKSTLSGCSDDTIQKCLVNDSTFWNDVFHGPTDLLYDEEVAAAINYLVSRSTSLALRKQDRNQLENFCLTLSSTLMSAELLSTCLASEIEPAEFKSPVLEMITNYLACLLKLDNISNATSTTLISGTCLKLKENGFLRSVSALVDAGDGQHIHNLVRNKLAPTLLELHNRLASRTAGNYPGPVGATLSKLMDSFFRLDVFALEKFLSVNEEFRDFSKLTLLNTIDLVTFFQNSNLSFKKKFTERLLFEDDAFPIVLALTLISNELHNFYVSKSTENKSNEDLVTQCILHHDILIFASMNKLLELWVASRAQDAEDLRSLLDLLNIALFESEQSLGSTQISMKTCLQNLKILSYSDLRKLQVNKIRNSHYRSWDKQVSQFDAMLSNQVSEFVCHQRLLQLRKGAWVYSENPLDNNVKHPKVYFVVLSDNQMSLLAREYKNRSEESPTVQGNDITSGQDGSPSKSKTTMIPLKKIAQFQHWEVHAENRVPKDAKLINILNKTVYTEVQILDKDANRLLKFYLDTKEASYIWLDGLKLIASASTNKKFSLSKDTKSQIETLIDLRKNVQMIGLDDQSDLSLADIDSESEEQYYNLNHLQKIATNFHYE